MTKILFDGYICSACPGHKFEWAQALVSHLEVEHGIHNPIRALDESKPVFTNVNTREGGKDIRSTWSIRGLTVYHQLLLDKEELEPVMA